MAAWHLVQTTRMESAGFGAGAGAAAAWGRGAGCGLAASALRAGCTLWLQRMRSGSCAAWPNRRRRLVVYIDEDVVISEKRVILSSLASSCFIHSSILICLSS